MQVWTLHRVGKVPVRVARVGEWVEEGEMRVHAEWEVGKDHDLAGGVSVGREWRLIC